MDKGNVKLDWNWQRRLLGFKAAVDHTSGQRAKSAEDTKIRGVLGDHH
jgi:hypothetical protein